MDGVTHHDICARMSVQDRSFGPYTIRGSEIFVETSLSFAFVNLKPVVPGAACPVHRSLLVAGLVVGKTCAAAQGMCWLAASAWSPDMCIFQMRRLQTSGESRPPIKAIDTVTHN